MDRLFNLRVRLPSGDKKKKWAVVDDPIHLSAASLADLCSGLHAALVGLGRLDASSTSVAIDGVFDGDEDWPAVDSLDEIPAEAKLRLTIIFPVAPHDIAYEDVKFITGEAGAVSPIARDATGAVIAIAPGSLSFQLQHYEALAKWLTIDERTGQLQGTPMVPCKVVDAEVLVTLPTGMFRVCRVAIQADAPTDTRSVFV